MVSPLQGKAVLKQARWALLPALLAVSSAAIFARLSVPPLGNAEPLAAAFWRAAVAGIALLPVLLFPGVRKKLFNLRWKKTGQIAAATVIIALHQICFITSLNYTSVAAATLLTSTQPVWTALLGGWLIREPVSLRNLLALAGALVGMALVTLSRPAESALLGNVLALFAALLASLFSLAARRLRQHTNVIPFMLVVNWSGAIFLGMLAAIFGIQLIGFTQATWTGLIMLGLIPTLIGHSLLVYAIGHMPAFVVNASILGEPVGATILAGIFLSEYPTMQTMIGGVVIVACVLLIIFERKVPEPVPEAA